MNIAASRRDFLKSAGAGALVVAFDLAAPNGAMAADEGPGLPGSLKPNPKVGSWLRIEAGGRVTLLVGKVELGQGILTAVRQICADELDIDINRINIISGDTFLTPNEGTTAGSFSMPDCGTAVRHVSADARGILMKLAADKLGVDISQLRVADGVIKASESKQTTYWDVLTGQEFQVDATAKTPLKSRAMLRYVGKSVPRFDIPAKATGGNIWVQDLRPDGMLHGRIMRPPAYDSKLVEFDPAPVEKMPGVVKVVRDGNFVGVIAEREETALAAVAALRKTSRWNVPSSGPTNETVYDWLLAQKSQDKVILEKANAAVPAGATTVEASFRRPYHMHASIGPATAVAKLGDDGVMTIQTPSQSVFETGAAIAMMLGMDKSKVRCQHVQGSGCYGHNAADDAAADAALLARAVPGKPVRVQWTRNDEHKWEPYGSAMLIKTAAKVDAKGDILDWTFDLWSTAHGTRPGNQAGNLLPARDLAKPFELPTPVNGGPPNYAADRNAIVGYDFPGQKVTTHFLTNFAARASSTRGLGAYANVFAIENFIDELARRAKVDPVEYRLRYLKDERGRAVLQKAAEIFGWSSFVAKPGRGKGIAYARYKNLATFCAIAMEVEVDRETGVIRVIRAVAAADSGEIVSPDGVRNQIEGGLIQALSWSLKEGVRFDSKGVKSDDWVAYPILTFTEVPPITVELLDRPGNPFLGAGEASQGPTAGALVNAVFDATGVRYRDLPLIPSRIKAGLLA